MESDWTPRTIAHALLETFPAIGRLMSVRMRALGEEEATFMQIGVLMHLRETPNTASELAKRRKVSLQSASVLVQGLVERGWLTRVPDPNDRRQSLLEVTPEGLARAEATQEQVTSMIAEILNDLSQEELAAAGLFVPALRRLVFSQMQPDTILEK